MSRSTPWSVSTRAAIAADAAALPLRTGSAAVVALINVFLFPAEVARVLANPGVLLWVSANGDQTPIYLPPTDVLNAMAGTWDGVTSQAGWGTWLIDERRLMRAGRGSLRVT